jgi:small ubiquitin-related modifier
MSGENENGTPGGERAEAPANTEHLNIKVTDNNNEVFFKIKRTTKLEKLMGAFCERQGKALSSVRFLFDGTRVQPTDTPDAVCISHRPCLVLPAARQRTDRTLEVGGADHVLPIA